jgi:hypothetical protein
VTQERSSGRWTTRVTLIALGVVIGLLMSGTALAITYLTKTDANKLYLNNSHTWVITDELVSPNSSKTTYIDCPKGYQALGGGIQPNTLSTNDLLLRYSGPMVAHDNLVAAADGKNPKSTGWTVRVSNTNGSVSLTYAVGVICSK